MILSDLHDFFLASVGASASFIGLLYVALTIAKERSHDGTVAFAEQIVAESAYIAFITIFFISMISLLPNASISWVLIMFGIAGVLQSLRMDKRIRLQLRIQNRTLVWGLLIIYAGIGAYGAYLAFFHAELGAGMFYAVIFTLYGVGLGRAWELVGFRQK